MHMTHMTILPEDYNPIKALSKFNEQINSWRCLNFLELNKDEEFVIYGEEQSRVSVQ